MNGLACHFSLNTETEIEKIINIFKIQNTGGYDEIST
jgi:hypothetical protein